MTAGAPVPAPADGRLPRAGLAWTGLWCAALVLASPADARLWAFNGLRSVPLAVAIGLTAAAALASGVARLPRLAWPAAIALAVAVGLGMAEHGHLLGDTLLRVRLLEALSDDPHALSNLAGFARVLHAQPLDSLSSVALPRALMALGLSATRALGLEQAALLVALFVALVAIARRHAPPDRAAPLALAALCAGTLELFAGYADGWALTLVLAAGWWASLDRPLHAPRHGWLAAGAWLALALSHLLAFALLWAPLWRALGPPRDGDDPRARRVLAAGTIAGAAMAVTTSLALGESVLARDMSDLVRSLHGLEVVRRMTPWDLAGLVAVTMPLVALAPPLVGARARAAFARTPSAGLALAALLPTLPMLLIYPFAPHGLGAHRDWDLVALPGALASIAMMILLAGATEVRVRAALSVLLPVLVLQAGSWVAVNADGGAVERRARLLVEGPHALRGEQAMHTHVYLAYGAAARRDFAVSAIEFERAAAVMPNPRHRLLAAQAWLAAGDRAAARRNYGMAVEGPPLTADVRALADQVEAMLSAAGPAEERAPADTARGGTSPSTPPRGPGGRIR